MDPVERSTASPLSGAVLDTVRRAMPSRGFATLELPAVGIAPGALLAAFPAASGFRWESPRGEFESVGTRARLTPDEATDLLASAPELRLVGGLPFGSPPDAGDSVWTPYVGPSLVLPRWFLWRQGPTPRLVRVLSPEDRPEDVLGQFERLRSTVPSTGGLPVLQEAEPGSRTAWVRHIGAIREVIRQGRFEKLVAARSMDLRFRAPVDAWTVLSRLRAAHPGCNLFLLREKGTAFLGASPETLLSIRADRLSTHALAGSRPASAPSLHGSPKNRLEHELVVRHIKEALAPHAMHIRVEPLRERTVGDIVHLETPIEAHLRPGARPLDIAHALHPTPAVGGLPHAASHDWILRHEPLDRGWYAGALGWIAGDGEAELAVALRSGLITGERVRAFAGAGIVEASDPDAEYEETALKMRPLLRALGVE